MSKLTELRPALKIQSPLNIYFAQAIKTQVLLVPQHFGTHHIRNCYSRIHLSDTNSTDSETYTIFAAAELFSSYFLILPLFSDPQNSTELKGYLSVTEGAWRYFQLDFARYHDSLVHCVLRSSYLFKLEQDRLISEARTLSPRKERCDLDDFQVTIHAYYIQQLKSATKAHVTFT